MGKARDLAKLGGVVNSSGELPTAGIANSAVTTDKIAANAVVTADIADSAVTTAKIANANVTVAKLSATGTPDSTTFLRGDGSWQAVSSTPTTAQVLTATAGASVGAVGTYALLRNINGSSTGPGSTRPGSVLYYATANGTNTSVASGTWRCMGFDSYSNCTPPSQQTTVWLRIS
jgi:hypothetical protein